MRAVNRGPYLDVRLRGQRHRQQLRFVLSRLREHQKPIVERIDIPHGVGIASATLGEGEVKWRVSIGLVRIARREKVDTTDADIGVRERDIHRPQGGTEAVAHAKLAAAVDGIELTDAERDFRRLCRGQVHRYADRPGKRLSAPSTAASVKR